MRQYQYKAFASMRAGVFAYLAVLLTTQVSLVSQCPSGSFSESNSSSTVETKLHQWKSGISVPHQASISYKFNGTLCHNKNDRPLMKFTQEGGAEGSSCSTCSDLSWRPTWLFPTRRQCCVVSLPLDNRTFLRLVLQTDSHFGDSVLIMNFA